MIQGLTGAGSLLNTAGGVNRQSPAESVEQFSDYLKQAIDSVAQQEDAVRQTTERFIVGEADVSEMMIVSEQAKLSLQLTAQIRNKVIEAYQEIMRMQV
ncbi:MAG: flagellar hook-basal body complex protein FliE [Thermobacillus sp.]|uniref:Flagellar hook-basal body complex protein FliE n=1 Tax=Thermobacillus composti (strain DSM 18247 / JCM 13945 / KWC4) TaxID=717605 RepID=L0ED77_THECK|nr:MULTISPECIES: flagellar hook-basal body complex protein FliE [Thermobacillus]AGA58228.1 flagellar hook-basal body complex protein FliE [Thermobacillus composti KWC4]REK57895.1 MAG: flagellar hook-basal body complex protein FliE [Thermobacillus sp.]